MKITLKVILASLVLFASHAFAQTTATTDPVGVKPRTAPVTTASPNATLTTGETGAINANQTTGAPRATAGSGNTKPVKSPRDSASGQRHVATLRTTQHPKPPAKK